jgi:DASS family divalent anion:Na+ symporter
MFFAQDYVSLRDWWRIGFIVSLVNLSIWGIIGVGWWKLLGLW